MGLSEINRQSGDQNLFGEGLTQSSFFIRALVLLLFLCGTIVAAPGDLDPSFGAGGKVVRGVGTEDRVFAMVRQPDGKLIVGGRSRPGAVRFDFYLARFNTDGSLDTTFGTGGIVITSLNRAGAPDDELHALVLQPDGRIIGVGSARSTGGALISTGLVRYNPNGSLDETWGGTGIVLIDSAVDRAAVLQADGKLVCGGGSGVSFLSDFYLARFNSDGTLDATFDADGEAAIDLHGSGDGLYGLAVQADGKIVAVGRSRPSPSMGTADNFAAIRLLPNGTLDMTFGTGGKVTTDFATLDDFGYAVAIQPDGKIIVAGQAQPQVNDWDFALARYNTDGSLDTSFGNGGKVLTPFGVADAAFALSLQPNGKIVVAGKEGGVSTPVALARYNPNGSLDQSFGAGGKVTTYFYSLDEARAVLIQPDGKIVAAGTADGGAIIGQFGLARFFGDAVAARNRVADFDGDGQSDLAVYRDGVWYLQQSLNGFSATQWGTAGDALVPADYDGDGKTDIAVFRRSANSTWYILESSNNLLRAVQWGATSMEQPLLFDTPVPADYDGDGRTDLAVYRTTDFLSEPGRFVILQSSNNTPRVEQWGNAFDRPVPADYDGDGRADLAVFRFENSVWYIQQSSTNTMRAEQFGLSSDRLVPADYDGDGKADLAVYRASEGVWYIQQSTLGFRAEQFGISTDRPVPADYDGDSRTDLAVFRDGVWYLQRSTLGFTAIQFGLASDVPLRKAQQP